MIEITDDHIEEMAKELALLVMNHAALAQSIEHDEARTGMKAMIEQAVLAGQLNAYGYLCHKFGIGDRVKERARQISMDMAIRPADC
jgi:hypothetical protein